jgi:[ribosomal protein S5]-alanine N-acetyltransferase
MTASLESVFPTFFLSGFECSTFDWHGVGRRDLTAETLVRIPDPEYIAEIRRWQALLNQSDRATSTGPERGRNARRPLVCWAGRVPMTDNETRNNVAMLTGNRVRLRPVREADLDALYDAHIAVSNRGAFYPLGVMSESTYRKRFAETGFWEKTEGTLVIASAAGEIAGHIEFFRAVAYWDAFELSYQLYDDRFKGQGFMTEAVQLLVDYLFGAKKEHRIHLIIVPENAASRRVAEKCGFTLEGTVRGAFFNGGRNNDVLMYSLLRTDPRPWHGASAGASD